MNVALSAEQQKVVHSTLVDIKREGKSIIKIGGFAGTGKTTVISFLTEHLPTYAVCAFTGKAANVLRRKGVSASTIHSLIYEAKKDDHGGVYFEKRDELACDGIIVDEASMVSREIYDDLRSFHGGLKSCPIIFVGDHGQLEPVGSDFNLMKTPDYRLEKIHRNAGEISRFAEWLRMDRNPLQFPVESTGQIEFLNKWEIEERGLWTSVDQIICAYNKTRVMTNDIVRNRLNHTEKLPAVGERIMCLRNNRDKMVYNGMQGEVLGRYRKRGRHLMDFESYGSRYEEIPFNPDQFGMEKTIPQESKDDPIPFDYAYCVTCHKAQGDEWDNVMVFEQRCRGWEHKRWTYTAASRAKAGIYWIRGM